MFKTLKKGFYKFGWGCPISLHYGGFDRWYSEPVEGLNHRELAHIICYKQNCDYHTKCGGFDRWYPEPVEGLNHRELAHIICYKQNHERH